MKTMQQRTVEFKVLSAALLAAATSMTAYVPAASAGHGAAWGIGGLLAGGMLTKAYEDKHRQRSYYTPPPPPRPTSTSTSTPTSTSTTMTPEQKIQQLNKLAAGGYITPQEYKTEKQAILNSIVE